MDTTLMAGAHRAAMRSAAMVAAPSGPTVATLH
jgi:hypothetical protein